MQNCFFVKHMFLKTPVQHPSFWFHFRHHIWNFILRSTHEHTDMHTCSKSNVRLKHNRSVVLGWALEGSGEGGSSGFGSERGDWGVREPNMSLAVQQWVWAKLTTTPQLTKDKTSGSNVESTSTLILILLKHMYIRNLAPAHIIPRNRIYPLGAITTQL